MFEVDARMLYKELEVSHRFRDWMINSISKFGLKEEKDYYCWLSKPKIGRPSKEYRLSRNTALLLCQQSVLSGKIKTKNRLEIKFFTNVKKVLNEISSVEESSKEMIMQYPVGKFRADCYFPRLNLIVEYHEKFHNYRKEYDSKRENEIKHKLKCGFIVVTEKCEAEGIGQIIECLLKDSKGNHGRSD